MGAYMHGVCMIYGAYMLIYLHIDEVWGDLCIGWGIRTDWGEITECLGQEVRLWTHS
jgi:hypothetical protein